MLLVTLNDKEQDTHFFFKIFSLVKGENRKKDLSEFDILMFTFVGLKDKKSINLTGKNKSF